MMMPLGLLFAIGAAISASYFGLYDRSRGGWQIGPGYNRRGFTVFVVLLALAFVCLATDIYVAGTP